MRSLAGEVGRKGGQAARNEAEASCSFADDRWMDGQTNEWMDRRMDELIGGQCPAKYPRLVWNLPSFYPGFQKSQ